MRTIQIRRDFSIDVPDYGQHLDIGNLQELVRRSGSHFFDRDTMRFFKSRVDYSTFAGPDGWYFITSEKHESHTSYGSIVEPRRYTVRRMSVSDSGDDLKLYTLFDFQAFTTLERARTAARNAARAGVPICPDCRLNLEYDGKPCPECSARRARLAPKVE